MPTLNRRQFSTTLAAVTGGMMVHQSTSAQSSSQPLGVAVCGVNGRGGSHLGSFMKEPRTVVNVLVDIDEAVGHRMASQVAEKQGHRPIVLTDVRDAIARDDVQVLSCATPNHWHALIGVWAMQAGKDVYIEKPISHNVHEGRTLVQTAEKHGRMFQTGTQCRSSTACIDAVEFIHSGGIGEVKFARGLCYKRRKSIGALGNYDIPQTVDFDLWSGPASFTDPKLTRQRFHYDWHWQRHYGNGDLGNQGPHQTDIARWGLGVNEQPQSILTYGGRLGYQAERKNPSYVDAGDTGNTEVSIYDYGDKTIVFETRGLSVNDSADKEINELFGYTEGNKIGVIFYGSEGYVVQTSYGNCVAYDKNMKKIKTFKHKSPYGEGFNLNDDHFKNFLDAVDSRDSSQLHADALTGHLSASVSHLGNISYYLGEDNHVSPEELKTAVADVKSLDDNEATLNRTLRHLRDNGVDLDKYPVSLGVALTLDPKTETFVNNPAADKLLTRDYRSGFEVPAPASA
ncbi:MAG: Gfo/Idh/MocA family oxidoreductase [Planctomycetota bacterium]